MDRAAPAPLPCPGSELSKFSGKPPVAELYLVRHAQASFHSADYDCLSALGERQSRWLGEYFASRDIRFDVLVTGHNLDDEAAVLFGNTLAWESMFLLRQGPVLPEADGLARKVKPSCRFYEREMAAYALLSGIEYIYEECPFAEGSTSIYYKELLNQLETTRPGAKLTFYLRFLEARANGLFREETEAARNLHPCTRCGQPTTAPDLCSFCRMIEKVNQTDAQESQ